MNWNLFLFLSSVNLPKFAIFWEKNCQNLYVIWLRKKTLDCWVYSMSLLYLSEFGSIFRRFTNQFEVHTMTHEITWRVEITFMWPSEWLNSFNFLVPSIWSIDFMRGTNTIGTLGGFGTNYIFLGNFQIFKKKNSQRFFCGERKWRIFWNILENQYSKVIKYLADMCGSWPPCTTSGHSPNFYHWHQNHFLLCI
jgi:hypothetical protein